MRKALASLALVLFVPACAGSAGGSYIRAAPTTAAPPPVVVAPPPQVMQASGLEGVIGAPARTLTQRFGEPRIDLSEGDARKLQFVSQVCVVDIFLYPVETGAAPVATHVEARVREGGAEADRAACLADIEHSARGG